MPLSNDVMNTIRFILIPFDSFTALARTKVSDGASSWGDITSHVIDILTGLDPVPEREDKG